MKQIYTLPLMEVHFFDHEHTITSSAISSTENALRAGNIKVDGKTLSAVDTILSIRF